MRVIITARRMLGAGLLGRRFWTLAGLAQTVPAQQKDLGVLHQTIGDGGGDGRIKEDVPQSENGVLVVMIVERLWLCRVEIT